MTIREQLKTGIQQAVNLEEVPAERFSVMLRRTIIGTALTGVGVVGLVKYSMNHYLAVAMILLGATTWSTQLVASSIKALVGPLGDILRVVRGGQSDG